MSKVNKTDDVREEYDFSGGQRGKHHKQYQASNNIVVLEPDVAEAFPDSAAVNQALRLLIKVAARGLSSQTDR